MKRSEMEAVSRLIEARRRAEKHPGVARPVGVVMIAGFQFLKAVVLLLTVALLLLKPELVSGRDSPLYPLLYVATRGRYDSMSAAVQSGSTLAGVILIMGLYLVAIGFGLLAVNGWARRTLILSSGLTLALFAKTSLWPDPGALASPDMTSWYVLLAVDVGMFVYLLRGNTAELFKRRI